MIVNTIRFDPRDVTDLMNVWVKRGYIDAPLQDRLNLECVYTFADGTQTGAIRLNPTIKMRKDGRVIINFKWMLSATEENEKKIDR